MALGLKEDLHPPAEGWRKLRGFGASGLRGFRASVMGVANTSSDKDSGPTFILFFTKITFLDTIIIQMCQKALSHKQSHNSDYPTKGEETHLFVTLMRNPQLTGKFVMRG